jgi:hypothetical protein
LIKLNFIANGACLLSVAALDCAFAKLHFLQCLVGLIIFVSMLETFVFVVFSNAHMLSVYGRCKILGMSVDDCAHGKDRSMLTISVRGMNMIPTHFARNSANQDGCDVVLTVFNKFL